MEEKIKLSKYGKQLWTRERAREIRAQVEEQLDKLEPGSTLVIDSEGVEVFDYSFANELFGKTLLSMPREYPERFLIVENLTKYTRENLSNALESLGLIMIERKNSKLQLLGKVHPADAETFAAISGAKRAVTSAELKDKFGINITAMNERLNKLTSCALVRRQHGVSPSGRQQYVYTVLL